MAKGKANIFTRNRKCYCQQATIEPTDKSIPPERITISIPILIIPIPETCFKRLLKLTEVKNTSEISAENTTSKTKINMVLYFIKN